MSGVASGAAPPVWQEESEDESEDLEPEPAKFVRKYEKSAMNTKLTRRLQDRIRELKTDEQAYIAFQERITEVLASLPPPPKPPPKPRLSEMTPHQREAKRLLQLGERRRRADAAAKRRDELGPRRRPARSRTNLAAPGAQDEAQEAEALEAMEAPPAPELPEHPQTPAWGDEHFADAGPAEHSFKSAQSDRMGDTPHSRYRRRVSLKDRIGAAEGARLTARPKLTTKHHRTSGSMAAYMAEVSAATGGGDSGYGFGDTDSEDSSSRRTAGYSHRRRRKHLAATLSKMRG